MLRAMAWATLAFLLLPLVVVIPISFNPSPSFTMPVSGLSLRWYREVFGQDIWLSALRNSLVIGIPAMLLATVLGTLAAVGLTLTQFRLKGALMGLLLAPMMVPHIITGLGLFFLYASIGLAYSFTGMILAHALIGTPFVILSVSAALSGFNTNLMRAALNLGAPPATAFRRVMLPLILPGVLGGAIMAFIVSFDDVIIALLLSGPGQKTLPRQIWSGANESVSPVIMAAGTLVTVISAGLMTLERTMFGRAGTVANPGREAPPDRR